MELDTISEQGKLNLPRQIHSLSAITHALEEYVYVAMLTPRKPNSVVDDSKIVRCLN